MNRKWIVVFALTFVIGFGSRFVFDAFNSETMDAQSNDSLVETIQLPSLINKDGKSVQIFNGQDNDIRIIYFGFTRCADVCPTSLAMLAGAYNELDMETLNQFKPMLISLDPERDSGADAHKYAQYFNPSFHGYSGEVDDIATIANRYGVLYQKTELENSTLEYTVDHSSYFYFIRSNGELVTKVPHTLSPAPIVKAIQSIVDGTI